MDTGRDSENDGSTDPPVSTSRRVYLSSFFAMAGATVSGCSSEDVNPPDTVTDEAGETDSGRGESDEESTSREPQQQTSGTEQQTPQATEAALGDIIEGDLLALAVYSVERTTQIGEFTTADTGNELVVIDMAAKNKGTEEFISFSSFLQTTLRDSEAYEYDQTFAAAEGTLGSGELAPGEVTRGVIVFEVPESASGLTLRIDLDESLFRYSGVTIDLESRGAGRTLTQDIRINVYEVGETLEYENLRLTPNEVHTSMGGEFFSPDPGNEFVIVDITVENTGDEEESVSTLLQTELKDAEGYTYTISISALSTLDRGFSQGQPIAPNSRRRGEIAFEVEQGLSPLYLMVDFDIFAEGDKSFFRIR